MRSSWETLAMLGMGVRRHSNDLKQRQFEWLMDCLRRNRDTTYGLKYRFKHIDSVAAYQRQVPLVSYEPLAPWIEQMAIGITDVLFVDKPVAFEKTGGSSGGAKLIPYSSTSLKDFSSAILSWLGELIDQHGITQGSAYFAVSPATRQPQATAGGIPIGLSDTAYLDTDAMQPLSELSAVPPWVGMIQTVQEWQLATLYWLLRHTDLVLISIWSPSFFLLLLDALDTLKDDLCAILEQGIEIDGHPLPPDHAALQRFKAYLETQNSQLLWPQLKLVSCWMDGNSRSLAASLQQRLPHSRFEGKGLLATEGVTTIPNLKGEPVLAADSGFYEFLHEDRTIHTGWELSPNVSYEVVLTTAGGLYRYRTSDLVRYEGMAEGLPVLRFLGRNSLTTDLVGEKLTEAFVAQCLEGLPGFHMLLAVSKPMAHYTLLAEQANAALIEAKLDEVDSQLCVNPQYAYARKLGQLAPLNGLYLPDPLNLYMQHVSGQARMGDIKVPALLPMRMDLRPFLGDSH